MTDLFGLLPSSVTFWVLTILAILRVLIKGMNYVIAKTPDKHDDEFLRRMRESVYFISLEWILEVTLGISLPKREKPPQE